MNATAFSRRHFFRLSSLAIAGAVACRLTGIGQIEAAWAAAEHGAIALDRHTAATLVGVFRTLYPHDKIGEAPYAAVLEGLLQKLEGDIERLGMLSEGVAQLDGQRNTPWLERDAATRYRDLMALKGTPFMSLVAGEPVVGLYNQEAVWEALGYEGPSYHKGGYLNRGFNDLDWLPDPPSDASPPIGGVRTPS